MELWWRFQVIFAHFTPIFLGGRASFWPFQAGFTGRPWSGICNWTLICAGGWTSECLSSWRVLGGSLGTDVSTGRYRYERYSRYPIERYGGILLSARTGIHSSARSGILYAL
jgi:hypothetical protein